MERKCANDYLTCERISDRASVSAILEVPNCSENGSDLTKAMLDGKNLC